MARRLTPAMQQFMDIKKEHPDCILFFRMGDFYETFFEDARVASKELEITLTKRGRTPADKDIPLAGIPYHALDSYLYKLTRKGYKVAIVEQLEDPKFAKGVVKRGLIRIVTPGTVLESKELDTRKNNFVMAIAPLGQEEPGAGGIEKRRAGTGDTRTELTGAESYGIAFSDISTGEFLTTSVEGIDALLDCIRKYNPCEIILPESLREFPAFMERARDISAYFFDYPAQKFSFEHAYQALLSHFNTDSLSAFFIDDNKAAVMSSGALLSYLKETQKTQLSYINTIRLVAEQEHMVLDATTLRNLEIFANLHDSSSKGTLFSVVNHTTTAMGARLLSQWLMSPLLDLAGIQQRQDAVQALSDDVLLQKDLAAELRHIHDIQRLISKIAYGSANARDVVSLRSSLARIPALKKHLSQKLTNQKQSSSAPTSPSLSLSSSS
ncbi:DNA mismatch repair protein MutS, partial [Candidatus Woesearchaeota archaeon CG_4_10_14_0_8_um_filter_47_5]